MTRVTNHAARRTKERLGLPKKLSHKNAANALRYGIRHSDTSGSLNRYISALYWKHETANNVRIYCNNVYIFHGETLITIFPLPQKYRKTAARITSRRWPRKSQTWKSCWNSSRSFSATALWWTASVRENLSACLTGSREKRGNERCGATQGGDAFPR